MRSALPVSWLLTIAAAFPAVSGAVEPAELAARASVSEAPTTGLDARILDPGVASPALEAVISGSLDTRFIPFVSRGSHLRHDTLWFHLPPPTPVDLTGTTPVLVVRSGLDQSVEVFAGQAGRTVPLALAHTIPKFGGGGG